MRGVYIYEWPEMHWQYLLRNIVCALTVHLSFFLLCYSITLNFCWSKPISWSLDRLLQPVHNSVLMYVKHWSFNGIPINLSCMSAVGLCVWFHSCISQAHDVVMLTAMSSHVFSHRCVWTLKVLFYTQACW